MLLDAPMRSFIHFFVIYFFFYVAGEHRDLHSFPTRRSSDLSRRSATRSPGASGTGSVTYRSSDIDRKSTRLNSSHEWTSYAVFGLKKKKLAHSNTGGRLLKLATGAEDATAWQLARLGATTRL